MSPSRSTEPLSFLRSDPFFQIIKIFLIVINHTKAQYLKTMRKIIEIKKNYKLMKKNIAQKKTTPDHTLCHDWNTKEIEDIHNQPFFSLLHTRIRFT